MSQRADPLHALAARTGHLAATRPGLVVLVTLLVSAGFAAALVVVPSTPSADSFEGDTEPVHAERRIRAYLPPTAFSIPFVVEGAGADGNILSRAAFDEILERERVARSDATLRPYVFTYTSPVLQAEISSVWSLPDTLRAVMNNETPLTYALGWHAQVGGPGVSYEAATDAQWQDALDRVLRFEPTPGQLPFLRQVSRDANVSAGVWHARSMFVVPALHHESVFRDHTRVPEEATPERPYYEDLQLRMADVLRADADETRWTGLGLGIQAEVEREVAESGRLVGVSFLLIGLFLFLTLRNGRDFLVAYSALPLVIVWMLGAARLLDLSNNQFTAMLPVLILALGVDFAIHGVRRYREERARANPGDALRRSVSLLGPALLLAAGTTATAFFSNAFSTVEALRDWGIEGGIAIIGALWICGVYGPALRHLWDRRRVRRGRIESSGRDSKVARRMERGTLLGRLAVWSGGHKRIVVAVLVLITVPAVVTALEISSDFDANDFLAEDSELVRGARLVERDFADEGEPAILLIEGDLTDPAVLSALETGIGRMADETPYKPETEFNIVRVVQTAMAYPDENDADYDDSDGNGIPDRGDHVRSLLDRALRQGVFASVPLPVPDPCPIDPGVPPEVRDPLCAQITPDVPTEQTVLVYSNASVRELIHPDGSGGYDMTVLYFGIPGTADFANIPRAADGVAHAARELFAMNGEDGPVTALSLTGEPFKRHAMVTAITDSLKISITVSIVVCFLIVLSVFRDLRYAVVTTLPVLVLVAWLFAFMVLVDLSLNLVTVTVAAMAIGVGIDYSIHITERFREEVLRNRREPLEGLRIAMDSSGVALLGSALTSMVGFLVLTFAPMPLFATFGLITAAMAGASFLAAATILPPLLVLVAGRADRRRSPRPLAAPPARAHGAR